MRECSKEVDGAQSGSRREKGAQRLHSLKVARAARTISQVSRRSGPPLPVRCTHHNALVALVAHARTRSPVGLDPRANSPFHLTSRDARLRDIVFVCCVRGRELSSSADVCV